jgi:hypothetical protein
MRFSKYCSTLLKLSLFALFLAGCATGTFVRYEDGPIVAQHQNVRKTPMPEKYDVTLEKTGEGAQASIKVSIAKNNPIREDWDDLYSKIGVYETRCKVYKNREDSQHRYCEFNSEWFWQIHAELIGLPFLYDIFVLPFWPYDARTIETKAPVDGTRSKAESNIVNVESPINPHSIRLTINGAAVSANFSDGSSQFSFASLRINPNKWPSNIKASVNVEGHDIDISSEVAELIETSEKDKIALREEKEVEAKKPQNRFKMNFCANPDLFSLVFTSRSSVESNCIYGIGAAPLHVLQVVKGGILVSPTTLASYILDKVILIKTKKQYVDGDFVQNIYVKSLGPMSYETVTGAGKTVNAFEYLGDIN